MATARISLYRRMTDRAASLAAILCAILVIAPLLAVFGYLLLKGLGSVNLAFLTHTPKPVGEVGGGMANAIIGSMMILGIGSAIGVPLGIGAGIYVSEY